MIHATTILLFEIIYPAGLRETGQAPAYSTPQFSAYFGRSVTRNAPASRLSLEQIAMATKEVTVYHLEMFEPNSKVVEPPRPGVSVSYILRPTVEYFRSIYDPVGEDYNWRRRRKMTREELEAIIHHPLNEFHVLYVDDEPAGFAELDRRQPDEIELVQFGLMPKFHGQGLGKWFLQYMIDMAWSYSPKRFWVHTCTLDHAAALPNYLKSGFKIFKQEVIQQQIG